MKHVSYECDICHSFLKNEEDVERMPTSESIHVCKQCFERWDKNYNYCLLYIHRLNLIKDKD